MKKIVIAGSRDFNDYGKLCYECLKIIKNLDEETIIISGRARGADRLGERFALENGLRVGYFPANWDLYGKSAGYKRNEEMAKEADILIAFWDGQSKGTKHMIDIMDKKISYVFEY